MAMDTIAPPPGSPQLSGHMERAQRGHAEESYEVTDGSFEMLGLNQALLQWGRCIMLSATPITGICRPTAVSPTLSAKSEKEVI